MPEVRAGRERLQDAIIRLSRASRAARGRLRAPERREPEAQIVTTATAPPPEPEGAVQAGPPTPAPSLGLDVEDLFARLDRIEERLSDLQRPLRPLPASRELYGEWLRLRQWEEIPFGDFLKLRRSGLL